LSYEICNKHHIKIKEMETDKDHVHYMIEAEPTVSVSQIINLMKSYTSYVSLESIEKICLTLDCKVDDILEFNQQLSREGN